MSTTNAKRKEDTDNTTSDCEHDWCDGPASTELPCFECFDPTREYTQSAVDDAGGTADAEAAT